MMCRIKIRDTILNKENLVLKFFPNVISVAKRSDTPTAETIKYRWVVAKIDSGDLSQAKMNDEINQANEKNKAVVIF